MGKVHTLQRLVWMAQWGESALMQVSLNTNQSFTFLFHCTNLCLLHKQATIVWEHGFFFFFRPSAANLNLLAGGSGLGHCGESAKVDRSHVSLVLCLRSQTWAQCARCGLTNAEWRRRVTSLNLQATGSWGLEESKCQPCLQEEDLRILSASS